MFSPQWGTLDTQFCSPPSSSWTRLKGYYFRPNYYLTSLSPADPAPPLFLWGTSLPEAHPSAPPRPPISQPHASHSPSPPSTNPELGAWGHQPETCRPWPHTQQGCCEVISPGLAYHRAEALFTQGREKGSSQKRDVQSCSLVIGGGSARPWKHADGSCGVTAGLVPKQQDTTWHHDSPKIGMPQTATTQQKQHGVCMYSPLCIRWV